MSNDIIVCENLVKIYKTKDIEVLAKAEAEDIIRGGYEEVVEEVDRLANIGAAKSQIKLLVDAVNGYKLAYKSYPEGENGLQALVENIEDKENWQPSLQGSLPKDPWGNDYIYKCPGDENRPFEIISYGADGEPGGEDENADINSWE